MRSKPPNEDVFLNPIPPINRAPLFPKNQQEISQNAPVLVPNPSLKHHLKNKAWLHHFEDQAFPLNPPHLSTQKKVAKYQILSIGIFRHKIISKSDANSDHDPEDLFKGLFLEIFLCILG
jgi:hypothetical protein